MAQAVRGARVFNTFLSVGNLLDTIVSFLETGAVNSLDNALTSGPLANARSVKHLSVYFTQQLTLRSARAVTHRQVAVILRDSPPRPQLASRPAWQAHQAGFDRTTSRELSHCVHFWSFRFRPVFHAETTIRQLGGHRLKVRACNEGQHISGNQRATIRAMPGWDDLLTDDPNITHMLDNLLPPSQRSFFPRMPYCTPDTFQTRGYVWADDTCTDVAHAFRQVPLRFRRSATSLDSVVDRELIRQPNSDREYTTLATSRVDLEIPSCYWGSTTGSSGDQFQ